MIEPKKYVLEPTRITAVELRIQKLFCGVTSKVRVADSSMTLPQNKMRQVQQQLTTTTTTDNNIIKLRLGSSSRPEKLATATATAKVPQKTRIRSNNDNIHWRGRATEMLV